MTWDGYFYGSIISTVAFQTGESLAVIIVIIVHLTGSYPQISIPFYVFPIPASLGLVALNIRAWYGGQKHIWMLGVKEAAANNILNIRDVPRPSLFGTRRTPEDEVRKIWATSWLPVLMFRAIWTTLKLTIIRRTVYVVTQVIHL